MDGLTDTTILDGKKLYDTIVEIEPTSIRRLERTPKEMSPELRAPSQSIGKMMEDVQLMLGFSQEEVAHLLSLLEKADFGSMDFFRGNTYIRFGKLPPDEKFSRIVLKVHIIDGDISSTKQYIVPRAFIRAAKRKSLGSKPEQH